VFRNHEAAAGELLLGIPGGIRIVLVFLHERRLHGGVAVERTVARDVKTVCQIKSWLLELNTDV